MFWQSVAYCDIIVFCVKCNMPRISQVCRQKGGETRNLSTVMYVNSWFTVIVQGLCEEYVEIKLEEVLG